MKNVLIIGYGNPLRSDDGVGRHAARRIAETIQPRDVDVLTPHQLTPDLVEPAHNARLVIFIDASVEDSPGKIRSRRLVPESALPLLRAHYLTPAGLMACVKKIYGKCPPAVLYSVGAKCFEFDENLSADVRHSLPELMDRIYQLIRKSKLQSNRKLKKQCSDRRNP